MDRSLKIFYRLTLFVRLEKNKEEIDLMYSCLNVVVMSQWSRSILCFLSWMAHSSPSVFRILRSLTSANGDINNHIMTVFDYILRNPVEHSLTNYWSHSLVVLLHQFVPLHTGWVTFKHHGKHAPSRTACLSAHLHRGCNSANLTCSSSTLDRVE